MTKAQPTLPSNRAFLVQFRRETEEEERFAGRVEHVVSGRAARFDSVEELLVFMTTELSHLRAQAGGKPRGGDA